MKEMTPVTYDAEVVYKTGPNKKENVPHDYYTIKCKHNDLVVLAVPHNSVNLPIGTKGLFTTGNKRAYYHPTIYVDNKRVGGRRWSYYLNEFTLQ